MKHILLLFSLTLVITIKAQTPQINAILVNSCGADEGLNELISVTTGSTPVTLANMIIDFPGVSPTNYCNTGACGTQTINENPAFVATLNGLAGCTPDLFVSAAVIPAGATLFIFTGNPPTIPPDYTSLCGGGPIYAIFCNNTTQTTGRFANSGTGTRDLTITFAPGVTDLVTYAPGSVAAGDGAIVNFTAPGVASYPTNLSPSCNAIALNVRWGEIAITKENETNILTWKTYSETNNDRFEIIQLDLYNGTEKIIGTVTGAGNSSEILNYSFILPLLAESITYYKIRQIDMDGNFSESQIISNTIEFETQIVLGAYCSDDKIQLTFSKDIVKGSIVRLLSPDGKQISALLVEETTKSIVFPSYGKGIYLVATEYFTNEIFKIICY